LLRHIPQSAPKAGCLHSDRFFIEMPMTRLRLGLF
jgi:hypothetical protein